MREILALVLSNLKLFCLHELEIFQIMSFMNAIKLSFAQKE